MKTFDILLDFFNQKYYNISMLKDFFNLNYPNFSRFLDDNKQRTFNVVSYGVHDFNYLRGAKFARTQNFYTLHYVLSGEGMLSVNSNLYSLKGGSCFLLPPDFSFSYYPSESAPWKYVWIAFYSSKRFVDELFSETALKLCQPYIVKSPRTEVLSAFSMLEFNDISSNSAAAAAAFAAILKFISLLINEVETGANDFGLPKLIQDVQLYMQDNYIKNNFSIKKMAKKFSISHPYLCRLYKKYSKMTLNDYLLQLRFKKACELLAFSELSVKETAYSSGFSDNAYFSRIFKARFNMTPVEYRDSMRQGNL